MDRLTSSCTTACPNFVPTWFTSMTGVSTSIADGISVDLSYTRAHPLIIPPIEQDAADRVEHDDQKNTLYDTDGRVSADVVDTASDLKSLITTHQGDDRREKWRLPQPDEKVSQR